MNARTLPDRIARELTAAVTEAQAAGARVRTAAHGAGEAAEEVHVVGEAAELLDRAAERVERAVAALSDELEALPTQMVWDHLVVALHAPTNAGKSTLLAALTHGDGAAIGDGSKDWTKTMARHDWHGLELLDTPGIEGREGALMQELEAALASAHAVAVLVTSKEPERGPLDKLAHRARRASEFVSLLNLRGRGSAWKRRLRRGTIRDRNAEGLEERIRLRMGEAFPGRYARHATLNAQLAFVCGEGELQPRWQDDRDKAREIFGTLEAGRAFSGIEEVEALLHDLEATADFRIAWSNMRRSVDTLGDLVSALDQAGGELHRVSRAWTRTLAAARADVEQAIDVHHRRIERRIDRTAKDVAQALRTRVKQAVDEGTARKKLVAGIRAAVKKAAKQQKADIEGQLGELRDEVRERLTAFREQLEFEASLDPEAFEELVDVLDRHAVEKGEVIKDGLTAFAGSVMAFLAGGPWLAAVDVAVAIAKSLYRWKKKEPRERRRRRLAEAYAAVDKETRRQARAQKAKVKVTLTTLRRHVGRVFDENAEEAAHLAEAADRVQAAATSLHGTATVILSAGVRPSWGRGVALVPVFGEDGGLAALARVGVDLPELDPTTLPPLPTRVDLPSLRSLNGLRALTREQKRQVRRGMKVFGDDDG